MKKFAPFLILGIVLITAIFSCKKDDGQGNVCENEEPDSIQNLEIVFHPVLDGEDVELEKKVTAANGYTLYVELFKFYISNLKLTDTDDKDHLLRTVELFGIEKVGVSEILEDWSVKMVAPKGEYKGLKFDVGVDEKYNYTDPGIYDGEHPLSSINTMHWNWNSGYIFMKFDGHTDTTNNNTEDLNESFSFHTGLKELFRSIELESDEFSLEKDKKKVITVKVDLDKFLKSDSDVIEFRKERITDATAVNPELAVKFSNFYAKAFSIE